MIDFIRCHFCSRANSILEATRRFLIVHNPALFFSPPCVNLLKRVCIKIEEKKRIHKDGERDQSYLVGDSFVFRYKWGSRRRTRWGDGLQRPQAEAVHTFVNVHENIVDIISIVVSRPAEHCGRAQDETPVRGGPTPQQQDTAKLIRPCTSWIWRIFICSLEAFQGALMWEKQMF